MYLPQVMKNCLHEATQFEFLYLLTYEIMKNDLPKLCRSIIMQIL